MAAGDTFLSRCLEFYGSALPNHRGKWWVHRRLRQLLGIHSSGERDVVRLGLRWRLDPADYVQEELFWLGRKDFWEIHHILRLLPRGGVACDVGANFGYYSLMLAARGGCSAVYAFEPNPTNFARLQRNIELNGLQGQIHAHRVGLSDVPMAARMEERTGNSGMACIRADAVDGPEVSLITLDDFCAKQGLDRLDFIKIDTEGFEPHVLRGGMETLARFKPLILIELNPSTLAHQGTTVAPVVQLLRECGYAFHEIRRHKLVRMLEPERQDPDEYINALCVPEARKASVEEANSRASERQGASAS
ncbi:MAG: FkbM family methyltransferase [Bacillota bacterium]